MRCRGLGACAWELRYPRLHASVRQELSRVITMIRAAAKRPMYGGDTGIVVLSQTKGQKGHWQSAAAFCNAAAFDFLGGIAKKAIYRQPAMSS